MNLPTTTAALDPVCGMTVNPASAARSSTHAGETYSFCSGSCKATFDATPEKFIADPQGMASCCGGHARATR